MLASSALAGCSRDVLVCQQPNFVFRRLPKLEILKAKFSFDFRGLLRCPPPFGAALFSDGRVIGIGFALGKPLNDKTDIFPAHRLGVMWKTRPNYQ